MDDADKKTLTSVATFAGITGTLIFILWLADNQGWINWFN